MVLLELFGGVGSMALAGTEGWALFDRTRGNLPATYLPILQSKPDST